VSSFFKLINFTYLSASPFFAIWSVLMKLCVVGSGYVGLVAGACFAENGNEVICVDINENRVNRLRAGDIPIYEPGLSDLVLRNSRKGRLSFTTSLKDGVERSKVIFIAVGTPQDEDGSADLTHVMNVARGIAQHMNEPKIVVDKSTVPVGTGEKVYKLISELTHHRVDVVSNPEFLKEGAAIEDFLKPDRVVVGVSSPEAEDVMRELYAPFVRTGNPILVMDVVSAELTKYAANAMLAARVSFMNEMSLLCEKSGADISHVRVGIGTDSRIGMSFLFPGIGYGGSCFPKDVQALIRTGKDFGVDLKIAVATEEANKRQKGVIVEKIIRRFGKDNIRNKKIAIWGLAFKPRTDDVREAPAITVCKELLHLGGRIVAYDPEANHTFKSTFGEHENLSYADSNYDALADADFLIICTEWNDFRNPDYQKMATLLNEKIIFDGRNILSRKELRNHNFEYHPIGRPVVESNL
jgi:UDPglucose 6-dehydrogenase